MPTLADWCVVDVVAPDGSIERLAVAHRDPARVEQAKRLMAKLPVDPSSPRGVPSAIRTQEPVLVAEICEAELEERYADRPTLLAELRGLGLRSYMTVPLVARGVSLGAITFVAAESGRTYGEADLTLAQELARRAAIAVDNALLYRDAILNESQVRFLAEADSVLNESLDYDTTLASLARLAVPQVADWCIVDIVEGAEIRRVAVAAADEEKQRALEGLQQDFPPTWDSPQPAAQALRQGGPVILEEFDRQVLVDTVVDDRHLAILEVLDPHSVIALPLIARGEMLGAITFAWSQTRRRYSRRDLPLIEDLASGPRSRSTTPACTPGSVRRAISSRSSRR